MEDFIQNTLSMVIVGDEENELFDGEVFMNGKKEGYFYHRDSLKQLVISLRRKGYHLGMVDTSIASEAGFDLVNMGHILFCNCTVGENYFGYVFLPEKLTHKQAESLKEYDKILQQFETLYLMQIDENDKERFKSKVNSYNFNTDELTNEYSKTK